MSYYLSNSLLYKIISSFPKKHAIILKKGGGDNMPYDALDVARYIVNRFHSDEYKNTKYSISNMKLQKLLYFVQAYFLVEKNKPCFKESIKAWQYGPVVPSVYHEFKNYGNLSIPEVDSYLQPNPDALLGLERVKYKSQISDADKHSIDKVVDIFKDSSAIGLMEVTHNQKPWKDAYDKKSETDGTITNEAIKSYFKDELNKK